MVYRANLAIFFNLTNPENNYSGKNRQFCRTFRGALSTQKNTPASGYGKSEEEVRSMYRPSTIMMAPTKMMPQKIRVESQLAKEEGSPMNISTRYANTIPTVKINPVQNIAFPVRISL